MESRKDVQHVYLVGAKSLGAYGGYETFVYKLTEHHQNKKNIKYHVACKANGDGCMDETKFDGVTKINDHEFELHNAHCFKIDVPQIGPAQAIYYDVAALKACCEHIKKNHIPHPIVYIMACRIGPFAGHFYQEIHKLGGTVYLNPDGHEWMRAKWSAPIRKYWKISEQMMVKYCDLAICDSVNIEKYIHECYDRKGIKGKNPKTTFIAYARKHEGDNGKTEMWYVIDAEEGAHLIYGFQHEVTEEILRKAVKTGTLDKHLQKVEVHKGDTYFVPAGTVHGIGKGILVAEIQESSNVTYRVYDYNRVDKNGKKRELHFDKAVQVMDMNVAPDVSQKPRIVKYYPGCSRELLCRCKYFETERIQVTKGFAFSVMDTSFQVLVCLDGYGEVQTMDAEQKPMRFNKGETLFLPAGLGRCLVVGDAELIKVRC